MRRRRRPSRRAPNRSGERRLVATVAPPRRPVLFYDPQSGDGAVERFRLREEACRRGIEPVRLHLHDDPEWVIRDAVFDGVDALAMAGGDGSQALVAAIASELDLPCACIPAWTRDGFALDLGVERDDIVGALDALMSGAERRVDLAEVNGRVFVNRVFLGVIAGAGVRWPRRHWRPGRRDETGLAVVVAYNGYGPRRGIASGARPCRGSGALDVMVVGRAGWGRAGSDGPALRVDRWSTPSFTIESDGPVPASIDGEAARLEPPVRFRIRPGALRVRIARNHPGAPMTGGRRRQ